MFRKRKICGFATCARTKTIRKTIHAKCVLLNGGEETAIKLNKQIQK